MATSADQTTQTMPEQLVQRARELRPQLVRAQADTEARTRHSREIEQEFTDAGFYRLYLPRRYGGYEFGPPTYVRVLIELARGCVSSAWALGLASAHTLQVASFFGERAQDDIFGPEPAKIASVAAPMVVARPDGDGWRLNGKVTYCSGSPYSTHFLGQAVIDGLTGPDAVRHLLLYVAPRSEWTMLDDWGDTLGLRGSGSNSIVFDNAYVPGHFVVPDTNLADLDVSGGTEGLALHGAPLYCGRVLGPFTMSLAAVTVGAGYNALDEYENQLRERGTLWPPMVERWQDPEYQRWYGAALGRLATAEAALLRCADEHLELCARTAAGGTPYRAEDELRLSVIAREVMLQVWNTVDECLLRTVGASVMREGTRFERVFRDLTMVASHRGLAIKEMVHRQLARLHLGVD